MTEETFDYEMEQEDLNLRAEAFLRSKGWKHTSSTPGCYWLWAREVPESAATEDLPVGAIILVERGMALTLQRHIDDLERPRFIHDEGGEDPPEDEDDRWGMLPTGGEEGQHGR